MIKEVNEKDIAECVKVIRGSFLTVANSLANLPILDAVVERLIELGLLTPPEDGIGAEGCWMSVEK